MVETDKLNAESKEARRTAEGKPEKFQHTARYLITLQLEAATINSLGIFLCGPLHLRDLCVLAKLLACCVYSDSASSSAWAASTSF